MPSPKQPMHQVSPFWVKNIGQTPLFCSFVYPRAKHIKPGEHVKVMCRSDRELNSLRSLVPCTLEVVQEGDASPPSVVGRMSPASKSGGEYPSGPFDTKQFPRLVAALLVGAMSEGGAVELRAKEAATPGGEFTDIVGVPKQRVVKEGTEVVLPISGGQLGPGKRFVKFLTRVDSASRTSEEPPDPEAAAVLSLAVTGSSETLGDVNEVWFRGKLSEENPCGGPPSSELPASELPAPEDEESRLAFQQFARLEGTGLTDLKPIKPEPIKPETTLEPPGTKPEETKPEAVKPESPKPEAAKHEEDEEEEEIEEEEDDGNGGKKVTKKKVPKKPKRR